MKKATGGLTILIFLLCAFSAQAASGIDISVPSAGEACSSDVDCGDNENCINAICIPSAGELCSSNIDCTLGGSCVEEICVPSVGDPCSSDLDCGNGLCINDICVPSIGEPCTSDLSCGPGELCINDICQESACEIDEDCDEGLICDNSAYVCVECLTSSDCQEGEFCVDNNTCVQSDECELIINPPRININKKKSPPWVRKKLKVKGYDNFDPFGEISVADPLFVWNNTIRRKRNKLEFIIEVTTDPMPDEGFYPIHVGNCIGEIELYDKRDSDPDGTSIVCEQDLDTCAEDCIGADGVCSPYDAWLKHDIGQQNNPLYVYTADMDGDGDSDMIVTSSDHKPGYASEVAWYRNEDKGTSWTKIIVSAADTAVPLQACNGITAQDFDQDGVMDIAVACGPLGTGLGGVYLLKGPSAPAGDWIRTNLVELDSESFFKIYPADMNGDGFDDVVAGGTQAGLIAVNPGNSGAEWTVERLTPQTGGGLHVADMDGDGTPEIINANAFMGKVILTKVTVSDGVFTYKDILVSNLKMVLDVNVLDVNEDGLPDILASIIAGSGFRWFENPGDDSEEWTEHMINEDFSGTDIFVGDINGDGKDDVIISGLAMMQKVKPPLSYAWFEYALSGGNVDWTMHYVDYNMPETDLPGDVALCDFNGDGKLDVASTAVFGHKVIWYENNLY